METDPSTPAVTTNASASESVTEHPPLTQQNQEKEVIGPKKHKRKETKEKKKNDGKISVWDHFKKDPSNADYASCNYCAQVLKCPSKNGTSSLHNHLNRCKKYPYNLDKKQKLLFFQNKTPVQEAQDSNSTFGTWSFDQGLCRTYLARMIVIDELPFMTVEHQGFREFMNISQPLFEMPSRTTVTRDCFELYMSEKESLRNYFAKTKQRVSLTTDLWSSRQNLSYMCLTAHFIDRDWVIHKRIINFCPVSGHSGDVIGKYVEKNLLDWGIDKVLTITVDNASSNDGCIRHMKKRVNAWKKSVLNSQHMHMRCCAHILSLVVKEGLKEVDISVLRIRAAVKYVRGSPARLQRFKVCVEKTKIASKSLVCLDVETRWNSTYLMLESAIKFQEAFDMLEEQDCKYRTELQSTKGVPTEEDWNYVRCLLPFLKGFYMSTLRISGSLYVTSDSYFHEVFGIGAMITKKMNSTDEGLRKMACRMKEKYDKYWSNMSNMNMYLFIAPILDPRHKFGYVSFIIEETYEKEKADDLCEQIMDVLLKLFNCYANEIGVVGATSETNIEATLEPMDLDDNPSAYLKNRYKKKKKEASNVTGVVTELDLYLAESCDGLEGIDLLDWWKKNEPRLPVIAAMAKDILAIPASTVASESSFSTGGRVLDAFRSSLTPTLVEALICTQNWLRSKNVPFEIEERLEDLENFEAELDALPQAMSTITVDD